MGEEVEPARLYELKAELDGSAIYLEEEVRRFCEIYFNRKEPLKTMARREPYLRCSGCTGSNLPTMC